MNPFGPGNPDNRLWRHYRRRVRELMTRFNDIRELIQHEGAKGTRVEAELRKFLVTYLPQAWDYASGIVVDSTGAELNRSRQEDILVIDKLFNPRIFLDEEPAVYPVDVLYAGIEVKTSIDERELAASIENIASLKRLQYVREGVPTARHEGFTFVPTTPPVGVIFAFDTSFRRIETIVKHLDEHCVNLDPSERPDLICVLNRGIFGFAQEGNAFAQVYGVLAPNGAGMGMIKAPTQADELVINDEIYPVAGLGGQALPIDTSRTFLAFLYTLTGYLSHKVVRPFSNLLGRYLPVEAGVFIPVTANGPVQANTT